MSYIHIQHYLTDEDKAIIIDCLKHDFPVSMMIGNKEESVELKGQWIPLSEKWPDKYGNYLVTTSSGCVVTDYYASYGWDDDSEKDYVIAWMPLPEPYTVRRES